MSERLKDMFFKRVFFDDLAASIKAFYPEFDNETFLSRIFDEQWEGRALKERVRHTTLSLKGLLPVNYRAALEIMRQVAPRLDSYGFSKMIFPDFVEVFGLDDWEASLPALEEFTQLASAEFAVRPFIKKDPPRMMAQMLAWTEHDSLEVRRLASEGCRPRLPWGIALPAFQADPSLILPILEILKSDESESVRRSVANNLNDISKDNPQVVIDLLREWGAQESDQMRRITERALRTLVKAGNSEALELLGYPSDPSIVVNDLVVEPECIALGEKVTISFEIESTGKTDQNLMIDYVVYLVRSKGERRPKVFKLTKRCIAPGERIPITKVQSFAPVTTRKYYPGEHALEIQINGKKFGRRKFILQ